MRAYDLALRHEGVDRAAPDNHGWAFGLPPGVGPMQWPLDPGSGYPLPHGFTLALPEDYRCHGPEIVALSFFATAPEHNDGGPCAPDPGLREAVLGLAEPAAENLRPFWRPPESAHPRLHRMEDILGCAYAVILLTQAEFDGALCSPPQIARDNLEMDRGRKKTFGSQGPDGEIVWNYAPVCPRPRWLEIGSARALTETFPGADGGLSPWMRGLLGAEVASGLAVNRAIRCTARESDPNAGKPAREEWAPDFAASGYQLPHYWEGDVVATENWRECEWAKGHKPDHIGGTMRPVQAIPEGFSPFYVEFEEYFGGYNFGSGSAQLDFLNMKFDWACG